MCLQHCNAAAVHGGGPADKVKLSLAMTRLRNLTATSPQLRRPHSVGAVGYAQVEPDERVPTTDFFRPQRKFRVRLRSVCTRHRLTPRVGQNSFLVLIVSCVNCVDALLFRFLFRVIFVKGRHRFFSANENKLLLCK